MTFPVDAPIALALLSTETGAARLEADLDPLVVEEDALRPRDLIEDELLLAIPVAPRHPDGECAAPIGRWAGEGAAEAEPVAAPEPAARRSPFAALAELKSGDRA